MKSVILEDKKILPSLLWRCLRWHFQYLSRKRPSPLACGVYITSNCNFKCGFCNIWRKPAAATLPLAEAKKIVDDLSSLGCFYFSITGGEPLLVDYLFDFLLYIRRSKIKYIHLVTNGYLLDQDKALKFAAAGINEVSISIDGNEEVHDKNRGVPGAYHQALKAIENLQRYAPDTKIVLNTIFFPENPNVCLHAVELARRFNVYVKVQPLNQHPVFNRDNYVSVREKNISAVAIKEVVTRLRKEDRVVNSNIFLDNIYNFFFQKEKLIFRDSPCLFGYHHLEILEDGSIFPCLEGLNWEKGMRARDGLKNLLYSPEYTQVLAELKKCRGCLRNYYICYYEPRITFPINNFLHSLLTK
jgi:MoaA/NifB/PqqE/SkfB family radical SAM enzyme